VEVRGVHHVAMAVEDLAGAIDTYERLLGARVELRGRMDDQGVDAVYLRLGEGRVELVTPLGDDTPVGRFLAKRGPGVHHVAVEVADLPAAIEELAGSGANVIDASPRPGLGGHEVSFVHPESLNGVLVEMVGSRAGA
jgi:methylmalonyl-CoA/ethylmalonyl-CoA epimerase